MSELINVLEECIEIVESEQYLIDKVIMSEKRAIVYINELRDTINKFLLRIENEFPDIDNFKYRRLIFSYQINPDEDGMIEWDNETWEVMKSLKYEHGGYEVYLRWEK